MLSPELRKLQQEYDNYMDEKTLRHNKAYRELEDKLYQEDFDSLSKVIAKAHDLYRNKKALKGDIRRALRQYGNPKFSEMWEMIPFDRTSDEVITYHFDEEEGTIRFFRTGWDWTGIREEVDNLEFEVTESENSGVKVLKWKEGEEDHAMFNFRNMSEVEGVINE